MTLSSLCESRQFLATGQRQCCDPKRIYADLSMGIMPVEVFLTMDRLQVGLQTGVRMVTNLRYADDIILLATSEAERGD